MSKLLLNEQPMMVIPTLAKMIGLNEAIILQQVHYWVQKSSHAIELANMRAILGIVRGQD